MSSKSRIRAEEYRARAAAALRVADDAGLERVRERHRLAAAIWTQLADNEDVRSGPPAPAEAGR